AQHQQTYSCSNQNRIKIFVVMIVPREMVAVMVALNILDPVAFNLLDLVMFVVPIVTVVIIVVVIVAMIVVAVMAVLVVVFVVFRLRHTNRT
ncbi:MAG: hypothetical protein U9N63_14710, partial [Pseudomonadota bacterium]|nr:hypothetical protein [Pseudomonadota bacterium]